jgi:starch synthase
MSTLRIAFVSPEIVPFAKTGGLADVAGALPQALAHLGYEVKVFMPLYKQVDAERFGIASYRTGLKIDVAGAEETFDLYNLKDDESGCEFYFIKLDKYYDRDGLYVDPATTKDWPDNDERFIGFARATLEALGVIDFKPNIIHCNDWQSGLIPAYLKCSDLGEGFLNDTKTLLTIHNLAYQGLFPGTTFKKLGLDSKYWYPTSGLEFYDKVSFLKGGLHYADILNTVSEKYAEEIQSSEEYGYGLQGVLKDRTADLFGVVNGIDYKIWNPATDDLIKAKFTPEKLENKKKNKNELKKLSKLPMVRRDVPLIGMISRLADQKGFDLFAQIAEQLFELDIQMAILGTGDEKYHIMLKELTAKYPKKLAVSLKFDNQLAHLIEAGSDMFLMPSRYEPCGLNQLYSLKYGTVPIVRETGGLADTIDNCNPAKATGTGFVFKNYDATEMLNTIRFAVEVYKNKKVWQTIMKNGMAKDFSWDHSAKKYVELYEKALQK